MTVREKIQALRREMDRYKVDAVIVPTSDPHLSEYPPMCWQARNWLTGFTGSAGTLVVTKEEAGLWTDGRYFLQAESELCGSHIKLYRMGVKGVPTISAFLAAKIPAGRAAVDGMICPARTAFVIENALKKVDAELVDLDLVSRIWKEGRPDLPNSTIVTLADSFSGQSAKDKIKLIRKHLKELGVQAQLYSLLEDTAWGTNLRGSDIDYNPFFLSYFLVTEENAILYVEKDRLSKEAQDSLEENNIEVRPYGALQKNLQQDFGGCKFLVSLPDICWTCVRLLIQNPTVTVVYGSDVIMNLKGVKNETELSNLRTAHLWDGVALTKFAVWLSNRMKNGTPTGEYDVCEKLKALRAALPENRGESFATIAAFGKNAAMMHYEPTKEKYSMIEPHGFLLIDSGGQFLTGTTDVTRTFSMGPLTEEERESYTFVLKAHISLAMAHFPEGTTGGALDALSREQVWRVGQDYRCGTGHGVGYYGGVHEGPQNFCPGSPIPLKVGMTITDEPGIYKDEKFGIRIENMLEVVFWKNTEYGDFYGFRPLTLFPIDTAPLCLEVMTREEKEYLNQYHKTVCEKLSPLLEKEEREWLQRACRPVSEGGNL